MRAVSTGVHPRFYSEGQQSTLLRKWGFGALLLLLIAQPFHFLVQGYFVFYRELFTVLFFVLFLDELLRQKGRYSFRAEEFLLVTFVIYIFILSFFDSGRQIYGDRDMSMVSDQVDADNTLLYVLRNAVLYIPMVLYTAVRGISRKELNTICKTISLVAPLSILAFLQHRGIVSEIKEALSILQFGASGMSYNSYVPYLTFPLTTSLYLYLTTIERLNKVLYASIFLFLLSYIIVSTSRQSFLFALVVVVWFFLFLNKGGKSRIATAMILLLGLVLIVRSLVFSGFIQFERLAERVESYEGFIETTRFEIMSRGLDLLSPEDYIFGAGLTSVIVRGPHNDYIRWIQRIGIPGMMLGFLPFVIAFGSNLRSLMARKADSSFILASCGLLFTLYHSFFGYPREDAYQSLYVFLGMAICLGLEKHMRVDARVSHLVPGRMFRD